MRKYSFSNSIVSLFSNFRRFYRNAASRNSPNQAQNLRSNLLTIRYHDKDQGIFDGGGETVEPREQNRSLISTCSRARYTPHNTLQAIFALVYPGKRCSSYFFGSKIWVSTVIFLVSVLDNFFGSQIWG